jgi:hypothetical protein
LIYGPHGWTGLKAGVIAPILVRFLAAVGFVTRELHVPGTGNRSH